MKKIFLTLAIGLWTLDFGLGLAATIKVNSRNFTSEPTMRRRVTLTLLEAGPVVVSPWLIAGDSVAKFTDTNGVTYFTNALAGLYRLDIAGSPGRSFPMSVFDTNGIVEAANLVNTTNNNPIFYTATQVDALIAAGGTGGGSAQTNISWQAVTNLTSFGALTNNNVGAVTFGNTVSADYYVARIPSASGAGFRGDGSGISNLQAIAYGTGTIDGGTKIAAGTITTNRMDATAYAAFIGGGDVTTSGLAAGSYAIPFATNSTTATNWVGSPYNYLKIVPVTEFNNPGTPSFGFKWSPDGTNFNMILPQVSYLDTGFGIFAPTFAYYSNAYWMTYDAGANIGITNTYGVAKSTDLLNWTKAAMITNNLGTGCYVYGGNFFVEDAGTSTEKVWLYFSVSTTNQGTYVTRPTSADGTTWATPIKVATYYPSGTWDPSVIKRNGTYFMCLFDPTQRKVHLLTNTVSASSTFFELQNAVSFAGTNDFSVEGGNFLERGTNDYILYVQATTASTVGKCFFSMSTNLTDWGPLTEVNENSRITDHGTTIKLNATGHQLVSDIIAGREALKQHEDLYEVSTTVSTGTLGPIRFFSGNTVAVAEWQILGLYTDNNGADSSMVCAFGFRALITTPDPLLGATNYQHVKLDYAYRPAADFTDGGQPDTNWNCTVVYTNGGYAMKFFSPSGFPAMRWRVRERVENMSAKLLSGVNTSAIYEDGGLYGLSHEGLDWTQNGIESAFYSVKTRANNLVAPVALTLGTSPYTWTNTNNWNCQVFIYGGVVSAIAVNGGAIGGTLSGTSAPTLQPGETVTVTYSSVPTMKSKPF